jgi:2-polyprenyl-3-methyl-5-hydroxy-6-metoxy-1,4-benzoquinol methylase
MMEYISCNLCGKDSTELIFEAGGQVLGERKIFHIVKCKNCGLIYVHPRPYKDEITLYYSPEYAEHRLSGARGKLKHRLRTLALESLPGYSQNTSVFNRILGRTLGIILLSQIDIVIPFKEKGRVLDIGCGSGEMIGWMKEYGWELYGVDIARKACNVAEEQGLKTFCGNLHEAKYPASYFDSIILNHSLEHMYNPLSLLQECGRILKNEGLLIVSVPNFGCLESQFFGASWFQIDVPRHLYHFTRDTLNKTLHVAGFQVDKWKSKMRLPLDHMSSIRNSTTIDEGDIPSGKQVIKLSLGMFFKYILSGNKRSEFSINLVAYASKHNNA